MAKIINILINADIQLDIASITVVFLAMMGAHDKEIVRTHHRIRK